MAVRAREYLARAMAPQMGMTHYNSRKIGPHEDFTIGQIHQS